MRQLTIKRTTTNMLALDAELRKSLGNVYMGLSVGEGQVDIYLIDETDASLIMKAEQMVIDHDPTVLTPEQEAEAARQQKLEQLRAADEGTLDLSAYDGAAAEVQALARKIAWLELEIRQLRGL